MPRYYFSFASAHQSQNDPDGFELTDAAAARDHALALAANLLRHASSKAAWQGWSLHVRDDQDREVFAIPLSDVIV